MNTDDLAKLYDRLPPAERMPLIIGAGRRGDTVESRRLSQTAPRMSLTFPDYFPLSKALQESATWHVEQLLDLAAKFWARRHSLWICGDLSCSKFRGIQALALLPHVREPAG
jgi:hypothetical protein